MPDQLACFGVIVGVALLLTGIGLVILVLMAFGAARATFKVPGPDALPALA